MPSLALSPSLPDRSLPLPNRTSPPPVLLHPQLRWSVQRPLQLRPTFDLSPTPIDFRLKVYNLHRSSIPLRQLSLTSDSISGILHSHDSGWISPLMSCVALSLSPAPQLRSRELPGSTGKFPQIRFLFNY